MSTTAEGKKTRLWTAPFIIMFMMSVLTNAGFYMTMPTLPKYAVSIGMSLSAAGVLTGIFSIVAIVARPIAGILSDTCEKRTLLVVFNLLIAVAAFAYALAKDPVSLYLCRILHGACFAVSSTVQMALTSNLIPDDRLGEGMGYMSISQIIAMSFAPGLGLSLADTAGYEAMFRLSAVLIALSAASVLLLKPEKKISRPAASPVRGRFDPHNLFATSLLLLSLIGGLFSLMNGVASSYLSMLGDERGIVNISIFFTISSVAVFAIRPFAGKLVDRKGIAFVVVPSLIFGAASMLCISFAWGIVPIVFAALLKGIAQSSGQASVQAECAKRSSADRRGVAMSTCYLGNDVGNSVGAALGGWLSGLFGYGTMFAIMAGITASGVAMMYIQKALDKRHAKAADC